MPTTPDTKKAGFMSINDTTSVPPTDGPAPGPAAPGPSPQPRSSMRWLIPTLGAIAAIGIGLIGGIAIGQNTASAHASPSGFARQFGSGAAAGGAGNGGGTGQGFGGRGFAAGGFTSGTIVSISGNKLVVKSATGTDVTVTTTSSTTVTKQQTVKLSDLRAGERVTAIGTPSGSNGSITARSVSEGAGAGGRFGRPGAGSGPATP